MIGASLLGVSAVAMLVMPHAVHETVGEFQWNAADRVVEVAIRVDAIDAEWVRRHEARRGEGGRQQAGRRVDRSRVGSIASPADSIAPGEAGTSGIPTLESRRWFSYVRRHVTFWSAQAVAAEKSDAAVSPTPGLRRVECDYRWIGSKPDGGHLWWFVEIRPRNGKRPPLLENTLLFDRDDDYRNLIIPLGDAEREGDAEGEGNDTTHVTTPESPRVAW